MIRIYAKGYTKEELLVMRDMLDNTRVELSNNQHCLRLRGCDGCPVRYLCANLESALAYVDRELKVTKK